MPARHHLVQQRTQGEQIRPVVGPLSEQLFRRGVRHARAPDHLDAGGLAIGGLERIGAIAAALRQAGGQSEVENLRVALRRDDDTRGGEGAVHEPQGVGIGQRVGQMGRQIERAPQVHRMPSQSRVEPLAGDELVNEVDGSALLSRLEEAGHVLMRERRVGLHKVEGAGALGGIVHALRHDPDRHRPPELRVAGAEHCPQRPRADGAQDVVVSDPVTHGTPATILGPGRAGGRGRDPNCPQS